jgi:putative transcriptional regulator
VSIVRKSNEQIRKAKGRVNRAKLNATTEADIKRYKREDGFDDGRRWGTPRLVQSPDVRAIRERLGLSQQAFAERFGLSERTVQEWEQKRMAPEGPARVLLQVIARAPKAVERALRA